MDYPKGHQPHGSHAPACGTRPQNGGSSQSLQASTSRVEQLEAQLAAKMMELRDANTNSAANVEKFERELAAYQSLAKLHAETAEERGETIARLEAENKALNDGIAALTQETRDQAKQSASLLDDWKQLAQERLEALQRAGDTARIGGTGVLAAGSTPGTAMAASPGFALATPAVTPGVPGSMNAAAAIAMSSPSAALASLNMTAAQAYAKYESVSNELQASREKCAEYQRTLDAISAELEAKGPAFAEQQRRYTEMEQNVLDFNQRIGEHMKEIRRLEVKCGALTSELDSAQTAKRHYEQNCEDLGSQIRTLLKENHELRTGKPLLDDGSGAGASASAGAQNAADVIKSELLTFKDVEEMQRQNQKLLAVTRSLSDQMERAAADAREMYEAKLQEESSKLKAELDQIKSQTDKRQERSQPHPQPNLARTLEA